MKDVLIRVLRSLFGKVGVELCVRFGTPGCIMAMRKLNAIQLSQRELALIMNSFKRRGPCNLLVFGLGNDSRFWSRLNKGGKTVFIEDNPEWFRQVTSTNPHLHAHLVDYHSEIGRWQEYLDRPQLLEMDLPADIENEKWDLIVVDAPAGWNEQAPGRMKSIFLATRLGRRPCDVFVHDCNRQVERVCCDYFLKKENFKAEVGLLRHYQLAT